MSRYPRNRGVQQSKNPLNSLNDIQRALHNIQQQGQQLQPLPPGRRGQQLQSIQQEQQGQQDETVLTDTEPYTDSDTSPQSINPRGFFTPSRSTSSNSVFNQASRNYLYPGSNRGFPPNNTQLDPFFTPLRSTSSNSVFNQASRNYLYPGSNRGFPPNNTQPRGPFDYDLGPTSRSARFLGDTPDMSSLVRPHHFATASSTSSANDSALLNDPDQNNFEPLGGNLVTNNVRIDESLRRTNAPATRGKKRGRQQQQLGPSPTKKFRGRDL